MSEELKEAKKYLQSKGYEFEPGDFWGEEYISNDHKWKDICEMMVGFAEWKKQQQHKSKLRPELKQTGHHRE